MASINIKSGGKGKQQNTKEEIPLREPKFYIGIQTVFWNKTTYFLMPAIGHNRTFFHMSYYQDSIFVNAYIHHTNNPVMSDQEIYLLYKFNDDDTMIRVQQKFERMPTYKGIADIHDLGEYSYILYKFSIPEKFREDYNKFLEGRYSEFSVSFKDRICTFHNASSEGNLNGILSKSKYLREEIEKELGLDYSLDPDGELCEPINLKDEVYDPEKEIDYDTDSTDPLS